ncbi:uncharacterized protein [Amphiura filiformis]|uniref:uncharacterized protein n=1 Tax=Amphiura filiformis TaxID=82378 RepID=UPI003B212B06
MLTICLSIGILLILVKPCRADVTCQYGDEQKYTCNVNQYCCNYDECCSQDSAVHQVFADWYIWAGIIFGLTLFAFFVCVLRRLLQRDRRDAEASRTPSLPWSVVINQNTCSNDRETSGFSEARPTHTTNAAADGTMFSNDDENPAQCPIPTDSNDISIELGGPLRPGYFPPAPPPSYEEVMASLRSNEPKETCGTRSDCMVIL